MLVVPNETHTEFVAAVLLDVAAEVVGRAGGLYSSDFRPAASQLDLVFLSAGPLAVPVRGPAAPPAVAVVVVRGIARGTGITAG